MVRKSFILSIILIVATFVLINRMNIGKNVEISRVNLDGLPKVIGGLTSSELRLEGSIVQELDPDVYVYRNYHDRDGRIINLYIGYYGTRKGGRTGHNPYACYPGAGWAIIREHKKQIQVEHRGNADTITVNTLFVRRGDVQQLVYHWYQTAGSTVVSSGFAQNLNRFKNRLLYNRNDGAFIRVSMDLGGDWKDVANDIDMFIQELWPLLVEYWPEERDA